jgi:hypothetical protein
MAWGQRITYFIEEVRAESNPETALPCRRDKERRVKKIEDETLKKKTGFSRWVLPPSENTPLHMRSYVALASGRALVVAAPCTVTGDDEEGAARASARFVHAHGARRSSGASIHGGRPKDTAFSCLAERGHSAELQLQLYPPSAPAPR